MTLTKLLQVDEMLVMIDEQDEKYLKCPHKEPSGLCTDCNRKDIKMKCMAAIVLHTTKEVLSTEGKK